MLSSTTNPTISTVTFKVLSLDRNDGGGGGGGVGVVLVNFKKCKTTGRSPY
jgi:hypothetical protein